MSQADSDLWKRYVNSSEFFNIRLRSCPKRPNGQLLPNILDLHGMTLQRAHSETLEFLSKHAESGSRSVLVICGKGDKISKEIMHWCMLFPMVSRCTAVIDASGGIGAYRVSFFKKK